MQVDLWISVKIIAALLLLLASFIISGSEVAYFSRRSPSDLAYRKTFGLLMNILIFNNFANSFLASLVSDIFPYSSVIVSFLLALIITFIGEVIPKRLALTYPRIFVILTSWIYEITATAFSWLKINIYKDTPSLSKYALMDSLADMLYYSDMSEDERIILAKLIYATHARGYAFMIPLSRMRILRADIPISEIKSEIYDEKCELLPVYFFSMDEIIGFVKKEDILKYDDIIVMDLPMKKPTFLPILTNIAFLLYEIEDKHIVCLVDEYGTLRGFACKESVESWILHSDDRLPLNVSLMEIFLLTGKELGPMHWDLADLFQYKLGRSVKDGDVIKVDGIKLVYEGNLVFIKYQN